MDRSCSISCPNYRLPNNLCEVSVIVCDRMHLWHIAHFGKIVDLDNSLESNAHKYLRRQFIPLRRIEEALTEISLLCIYFHNKWDCIGKKTSVSNRNQTHTEIRDLTYIKHNINT